MKLDDTERWMIGIFCFVVVLSLIALLIVHTVNTIHYVNRENSANCTMLRHEERTVLKIYSELERDWKAQFHTAFLFYTPPLPALCTHV